MPIRAYIQFYKDIIPFVLVFTLLSKVLFGSLPAIIIFLTIGIGIGFLAFSLLKNKEFYFYYNLGITKWNLFKSVFLINLIVGTPILILFFLTLSYIFGDFRIT